MSTAAGEGERVGRVYRERGRGGPSQLPHHDNYSEVLMFVFKQLDNKLATSALDVVYTHTSQFLLTWLKQEQLAFKS